MIHLVWGNSYTEMVTLSAKGDFALQGIFFHGGRRSVGTTVRGRDKSGPYDVAMNGGGSFRKESGYQFDDDIQILFLNRIVNKM
jgi:hypothetical protein